MQKKRDMMEKIEIEGLLKVAKVAGEKILEIYNDEELSKVSEVKGDSSPLTLADHASHNFIVPALRELYPDYPIISEEGKDIPYDTRRNWEYFWLVDPLDGTKEFIKRNGQFTVNIALMNKNKPVVGIVYVPVTKVLYYGGATTGAYKAEGDAPAKPIRVNNKNSGLIAVKSKSHGTKEDDELLAKYNISGSIEVGSSLKFCMVAEGKADIYYRAGPTMEWDTAAGQAVVEGAGGKVFKNTSEEAFEYNKENLLNGSFLCVGF